MLYDVEVECDGGWRTDMTTHVKRWAQDRAFDLREKVIVRVRDIRGRDVRWSR